MNKMEKNEWIEKFEQKYGPKPTPLESVRPKNEESITSEKSEDIFKKTKNFFKNEASEYFKIFEEGLTEPNKKNSSQINTSTINYNEPLDGFKLKRNGTWLNVFLVLSDFIFVLLLLSFLGSSGSNTINITLPILIASLIISWINMIPTLISHTNWKYLIFIFNVFFGLTVFGWIILLIIANATNNSAKREQEMAYLLRKMSDKIGDEKIMDK